MNSFDVIEDGTVQRTALVVLGASGMGASAVANLLADLGCDAPVSDDYGTAKIADLNNAVLGSLGIATNDWGAFNRSWLSSLKAAEFSQRALAILKAEYGGSYLAVMHEPSTARLLPFWMSIFDRAGIVPRYICIVSDPREVAEYLHSRFGIEHRAGHLVWLRNMLDTEANSRGSARAFVKPEQLDRDPAALMSLAKTLELTFPRDIRTTLSSRTLGLRRAAEITSGEAGPPVTSDWVALAYQTLKEWSVAGESPKGRLALDAVREAFDKAIPAFPGISERQSGRRIVTTAATSDSLAGENNAPEGSRKRQEPDIEQADALEEAKEALRARYREIVTLTRMLAGETAAAQKNERNAKRMAAIALAFDRAAVREGPAGFLDWIIPWRWRWKEIRRSIDRGGLFDSEAYLRANVDVRDAGVDPLRHYIAHGAIEGRPLGRE